jgi:CDP-diacylglycerol--glycerol-3-phosphate 3-phosphatidyltransferase
MQIANTIQKYQDKLVAVTVQNWFYKRGITPNQITYSRFVISFIILLCLFVFDTPTLGILVLFIAGALTDMIDGSLARNTNQITDLGKTIDPLADKTLIFTLFLSSFQILPHWVIYSVIGLELLNIVASSLYCFVLRKVNQANFPGKVKMFLEVVGILFVLLAQLTQDQGWSILSKNVFVLALVFLTMSIIERTFWFLRTERRRMVTEDELSEASVKH